MVSMLSKSNVFTLFNRRMVKHGYIPKARKTKEQNPLHEVPVAVTNPEPTLTTTDSPPRVVQEPEPSLDDLIALACSSPVKVPSNGVTVSCVIFKNSFSSEELCRIQCCLCVNFWCN